MIETDFIHYLNAQPLAQNQHQTLQTTYPFPKKSTTLTTPPTITPKGTTQSQSTIKNHSKTFSSNICMKMTVTRNRPNQPTTDNSQINPKFNSSYKS